MATKYSLKMIKKFFEYLLCYLVFPFSHLVPRSGKKLAFGSYRGAFCDNSKYLLIELSNRGCDAVWLSPKRETVRLVRSKGLRAEWIFSPRGAWRALRSKYWVVSSYTSDIFWAFSGGACVLNLWHGVGIKRIEYNSLSGPLYDRYIRKTFKQAFFHPESYRKPQYLLTASEFQTPMFAAAFRIPASRCIECGYPRNRILNMEESQRLDFIRRYENEKNLKLIEDLSKYRKVWIYMPTWRDSQREIFVQGMNLSAMQEALQANGDLLLLKPHANTLYSDERTFSNILTLPSNFDVQPLLPYTDVLISDYSSVLYDYILMKRKGVVLYLYDKDEYLSSHPSYYPFDENVIGEQVGSFNGLLEIVSHTVPVLSEAKRQALVKKFWGDKAFEYDFSHYLHLQ